MFMISIGFIVKMGTITLAAVGVLLGLLLLLKKTCVKNKGFSALLTTKLIIAIVAIFWIILFLFTIIFSINLTRRDAYLIQKGMDNCILIVISDGYYDNKTESWKTQIIKLDAPEEIQKFTEVFNKEKYIFTNIWFDINNKDGVEALIGYTDDGEKRAFQMYIGNNHLVKIRNKDFSIWGQYKSANKTLLDDLRQAIRREDVQKN